MASPIDLKLTNIPTGISFLGYYDISIGSNGDFLLEDGLDTNLIMSMFCEKRASLSEISNPAYRRGWWGNLLSDKVGFENGSKLWLLYQSRITTSVQALMKTYISESLQWLKDDKIADNIEVDLKINAEAKSPSISATISLTKTDGTQDYKYFDIWSATGRS